MDEMLDGEDDLPTHQQDSHSADRLASIYMNDMFDAEDVLDAQLQKTAVQDNKMPFSGVLAFFKADAPQSVR